MMKRAKLSIDYRESPRRSSRVAKRKTLEEHDHKIIRRKKGVKKTDDKPKVPQELQVVEQVQETSVQSASTSEILVQRNIEGLLQAKRNIEGTIKLFEKILDNYKTK